MSGRGADGASSGRLGLLVLGALLAGTAVGLAMRGVAGVEPYLAAAETVGGLWLDALRMTIVPLVFALVVTGIAATADAAGAGRLAGMSVAAFLALMGVSGVFGMAGAEIFLRLFPLDPEAARGFVAAFGGTGEPIQTPDIGQSLRALVPTNPVAAAAETAILPLVVFATVFGFAASQIRPELREPFVGFFRATAETMVIIVGWVLVAAPLGVFALALTVAARAGVGAGPILLQYIAMLIVIQVVLIACLYLLPLFGRTPIGRFAAALAPVQALAASTQSSLACLPAMVHRSREVLKLPERVIDLVLPLGVALFRITGPAANVAVAWFIAALYGVEPNAVQIALALMIAPLMSAGAVGLPGQVSFFTSIAPITLALGAPVEILAVLLAVEVIPDILRTVGNVTGHMGAAAALSRGPNPRQGS